MAKTTFKVDLTDVLKVQERGRRMAYCPTHNSKQTGSGKCESKLLGSGGDCVKVSALVVPIPTVNEEVVE